MGAFKTLDHVDVAGKACLVRVDLNVPMEGGVVTDDTRIRAVAPTITELSDKGAKVILLAHFGRPKDGPEAKNSLKQIVPDVAKVIGRPVAFATECVGDVVEFNRRIQFLVSVDTKFVIIRRGARTDFAQVAVDHLGLEFAVVGEAAEGQGVGGLDAGAQRRHDDFEVGVLRARKGAVPAHIQNFDR